MPTEADGTYVHAARRRFCRSALFACAALAAGTAALGGCAKDTDADHRPPVAIGPNDACAVCGMYIKGNSGPRGEAYVGDAATPLKFESTRDFFAYVLQPDLAAQLGAVYVQDVARIDWQHPGSAPSSFTDAHTAYYVAWHTLRGGMGPTFASFAKLGDAQAFVAAHGGQILRFGDVTAELVSQLAVGCPPAGSKFAKPGADCKGAPAQAPVEAPARAG